MNLYTILGHIWAANAVLLMVFWYITGVPGLALVSFGSFVAAYLAWRRGNA